MSENNYDSLITPTLVRNMFENEIVDSNTRGWGIVVCGKILTINGKMLFTSRTQAVKAFYNSYCWRAKRAMHFAAHPSSDLYRWWDDENAAEYWKTFKNVLTRDYGLKFVKLL